MKFMILLSVRYAFLIVGTGALKVIFYYLSNNV